MSIQSEITLLQGTKKEIRNAIMEKGVTVSPSDLFSSYPTRISQISMTPGDKDTLFRSMIERTETSLVIPTGTEVIRYGGFTHYDTLASITIPDTVTTIEDAVFVASGLTSVTIPKNVTSIGSDAFRGCSSLASITVNAETPPTLGTRAFDNTNDCPIYVPEGSVEAYKAAWSQYADRIVGYNPNALFNSIVDRRVKSINIPDSVASIGDYAFSGCSALTSVTIPDSVTTIGRYAFSECSRLTSVTIPNTVTSIGTYAFSGVGRNEVMDSIEIPGSVKKISDYMFSESTNVKHIILNEGTTSIGQRAFYFTGLQNITIPSTVTSIGKAICQDCNSMQYALCLPTTPPTLAYLNTQYDYPFGNNSATYPIYVPAESVDAYKTATGWSSFASRIQAIQS